MKITISYGYDIHSIEVDDATYTAIKSGQVVTIEGQGFFHEEGGEVADQWIFNEIPGEIYFQLGNGAQFRAQDWWVEESSQA